MTVPVFSAAARATRRTGAALLLLAWLLALLPLATRAQTIPPRPDPPRLVNDLAGLLQPEQVQALEQKLVAYNDSTSSQIAVVTVPNLDGDDIADYAQKLYEAWGIGRKGKNNGILVLVAQQEHTARIQTGYGLEGAVPDALAKRIISNTLVPAFRQNNYFEGLDTATDELIALAKGEYKGDPSDQSDGDHSGSGIPFWAIIIILVFVFFLLSRGNRGGRGGGGGGFIPPIIFGDFSGGRGVFGGGGGGWGGGGGGGGGFGGFGGGSSGGGGASGSW